MASKTGMPEAEVAYRSLCGWSRRRGMCRRDGGRVLRGNSGGHRCKRDIGCEGRRIEGSPRWRRGREGARVCCGTKLDG